MKLAFCLFNYFPYGGLQRDFLRIARTCQKRGHEVHVYTMEWEGNHEQDFHLHLIKIPAMQNHTRAQAFAEKVKAELEPGRYDLVVGFNKMPYLDLYYAADVCYQARVHEQRAWWYRLLPRYRRWVALEKAVFARGKNIAIMLLSPLQQQAYMQWCGTEPERFHLLPPGIAKDRIAPANASEIRQQVRSKHQLTDKHFLLLMIGSGFKTKGVDRAIAALAAIPKALKTRCQLYVIGQDDPRAFQALAKRLHVTDQVQFLGGRSDVADFLQAADILIHPSYHENTGTVLLEALASGLPVLTVDACGYAHYVQEAKAGIVLPLPFKQEELNLALQKMLSSPDMAGWRQNGLSFAKQTDLYSLPDKAADLIENVGRNRVSSS